MFNVKDLLSIGEFSKYSGIPGGTLRYWEDIGLFIPAKRDPKSNYRYYRPEQIIAVNCIRVLSSLNIKLQEISRVEKIRNPELVLELIAKHEKELEISAKQIRESFDIINTRRELIRRGLNADPSNIKVQRLPEEHYIIGTRNIFQWDTTFYSAFRTFCEKAEEYHINLSYPIGGMHGSMEEFLKAPGEPNYFFSVDPHGTEKMPEGLYMVGYAKGYYGNLGDLPERMAEHAKVHNLKCEGPLYVIYLLDEVCILDPDQYLAQVCIAIS